MSYCQGYSLKMSKVLTQASGVSLEEINTASSLMFLIVCCVQAIIMAELGIYLLLFYHLYQNNELVKASISEDVLKSRRKRNLITLTGQFATFVVETSVSVVIQIAYITSEEIEGSGISFMFVSTTALMTICHFWASPELKRFYFKIK